ncbi:Extracellular solute-binding protein family 5 OS=Thermoanaerobacter italicus (strain DSM 9252 / Ab9) GN=Thit_0815 PE=4 SV=1: SBP_bac_5 [Gemmata massiliana]|uniref:Solute-binding protein family 5 domain-containing protein n=1 Tax=Gemmata massiliana TaxID=1210884 RepID=A0A6P2D1P1_9BACT|nr:ABC transporter substrate-binding protein [Gemmata massiliana]VTR94295.1 Extracellular solute-binding protein family 5 OS=Thermoanaerobacter italicus (strain DSM 9252 / Ab9) GN=Thit_0815 PE=4 SV=1: SBP_bac_5 [Gemmata massiliana]
MSDPARPCRSWHRVSAALVGLLTAFALGVLAQPPVEEEDPKAGVKKRIKVEDDPVAKPVGGAGATPDARLDELARAAEESTNPAVKELLLKHVVPFDRLTTKAVVRIKPIPIARGERFPAQFGIQELDREGNFTAPQAVNTVEMKRIDYFEEIVLAEVNQVLAVKPLGATNGQQGWTAIEQIGAAERLLSAALRFHDFAREHNIRRGRGWDEVRKPLVERVREVRLLQLKNAVNANDWLRVREYGSRLILVYPKDAEVAAEVATARVLESKRLLTSEKHFDHVKARELLDEFEASFPGAGGDAVRAIRTELTRRAEQAFARAKERKAANDTTGARDALTRAVALDPTLAGARDLQRELKTGYQTLYVGVRQYPELMSPSTARLDSEKQAVELMFEGLLAEVPDDGGGARYRPAGVIGMPAVVPGAREFSLRTFDAGATGRYGFESHDVVGTMKLLASRPDSWSAYTLPWLDDLPTPRDNTTVRVAFKQGHPDPRAALTFKLLPARWMESKNMALDDRGFAEQPLGTGPFKLYANPRPDGNTPREMVFVDNPLYGRLRDRANQPFIKEVRLLEIAKVHNVIETFNQGGLHVLTDVPTAEIEKYRAALGKTVRDYTATNNRRVHMLALNHRRPALQSKLLRQGLMLAIDREAILNDVYRSGKTEFHRAMTGPFPPRCWANPKGSNGQVVQLLNRDLALTRFRNYLFDMGAKSELELIYPSDDPQATVVCTKIKEQIESLFKDAPGRKLTIKLVPQAFRELMLRVEDEHRFDIAYVPFDYPDDWYPFALGAMLDSAAGERGGRNWTGFQTKNTGADAEDTRLGQLLNELRAYREFNSLASKTTEVHKQFNECVPFVPLWQIDRHVLFHESVKVYTDDSETPVSPSVLNPTTLFQGIARWRLE